MERSRDLPALRTSRFRRTPIDDKSLEHLTGVTQIQTLYLGDTPITDAGIESLKGLKDLKFLGLNRTFVTDDGIATLLKAVPGVIIPTRELRPKDALK